MGKALDIYVRKNANSSLRTDYLAQMGDCIWPCALGRNGAIPPDKKEEGDGKTPIGAWPLRNLLYRADRLPPEGRGFLPEEITASPLRQGDGWCDDPSSADYNRPVVRPYPHRHEKLWREDGAYDIIGVLGYNDEPVEKGRGSAIFLHVAKADYSGTEGCIVLALPDLKELLAAATKKSRIVVG